jgi:YidC/Oxa1 family membrane protein insertase
MEKRTLAAITLSVLVLFAWRYFEEKRMKELARNRPPVQREVTLPTAAPIAAASTSQLPAEEPKQSPGPLPADTHAVEQPIVLEGALYRAVLDNKGAVLTSWHLNNFRSGKNPEFEMIAAAHFAEARPYPGALILDDPAVMTLANNEFYEVQISNAPSGSKPLQPPLQVTMKLKRGDIQIVKSYKFIKDNYLVDCSVTVEQNGRFLPGRILLGQDIGPEYEHLLNPSVQISSVYNVDGKVKREAPPKDENQVRKVDGSLRWVGLDMHYFAVIAIPQVPFAEFEMQKRSVMTMGLDQKEVNRALLRLTLPTSGSAQFQLYMGPKAQSFLDSVKGADLSGVIDYGMFWFLVRPLLASLKWIHNYVRNYGLAIILLTLLLTLLLFPIRLKQMVSMKKMQVVQPKVKEIQERYKRYKKTDPKRAEMNQEIMALYKEHNVNPLGGCLPLILQMPLLFAFYQLLAASIELRQAPFFGWIQDLAQKDPYYILPIVMGITMLISQRMTPMAPGADPTQAKMMMIMPAVFTLMFLNVSSGLNLYFLCSNIFQIGFQKIAERWIGDSKPAVKSRR